MDEMYKMLARERQADVDREAANAVLASAGRGLPRALQRLPQGRRLLLWGAKTLFTPRDNPDLRAEPTADAQHG
jgi:hypothetical protein